MAKKFTVFVYGTLKGMDKDEGGRWGPPDGITFLGVARSLLGNFTLHGDGPRSRGFPVANYVEASNTTTGHLLGELYEVSEDVLKRLHQYEGAPYFYDSEEHYFERLGLLAPVLASVYLGREVNDSLPSRPIIMPDENENLYWPYNKEHAYVVP